MAGEQEVHYRLELEDLLAYAEHALRGCARGRALQRWRGTAGWLGAILALAAVLATRPDVPESLVTAALAVTLGLGLVLSARAAGAPRSLGRLARPYVGGYRLGWSAHGLRLRGPAGERDLLWPEIDALERTASQLLLWNHGSAIPVPLRYLSAPQAAALQAAHAEALPAHARAPAGPRAVLAGLAANLRAAARLLFWAPARPERFRASVGQAGLLAALLLGLGGAFDLAITPAPRQLDGLGLALQGSLLLVMFASVALIARLQGAPASTLELLVMLLAVNFVLYLPLAAALALLHALAPGMLGALPWALYLLALAWMLAVLYRALRAVYGLLPAWALAMTGLYGCANYALELWLPPAGVFRPVAPPAEARPESGLNVEDTFADQPALLARALARLQPGEPGRTELYFLGFAGDAGSGVFRKEARYARNLFDSRFGTRDRSLLLVNSMATVRGTPLASVRNLEAALQGLSGKMDREEDVLVLFLTSHGEQDRRLTVDFGPLALNDLTPAELVRQLDRADIRWRVVIVSACFSGAFLEPLKDPHSLVITAAAADRSSFGCDDRRDLTWFGEALLAEALENTRSLPAAFEAARERVRQRELANGKLPSEPQLFLGEAMGEKLERVVAALEQGERRAPAGAAASPGDHGAVTHP